jgi:hypothetical protein
MAERTECEDRTVRTERADEFDPRARRAFARRSSASCSSRLTLALATSASRTSRPSSSDEESTFRKLKHRIPKSEF